MSSPEAPLPHETMSASLGPHTDLSTGSPPISVDTWPRFQRLTDRSPVGALPSNTKSYIRTLTSLDRTMRRLEWEFNEPCGHASEAAGGDPPPCGPRTDSSTPPLQGFRPESEII